MHGELRLLHRAGLSGPMPWRRRRGAPPTPREEEGRIADLLLVAGDLESDLTRSTAIAGLWKDGFSVEAAWAIPEEPE